MLKSTCGFVLTVVIASLCFGTKATAGVRPTTKPTDDDWTPQSICAALAWREDKLSKCSFTLAEDCTFFDPGNLGGKLLSKSEIRVKVKDRLFFIDLSQKSFGEAPEDIDHALQTWNGIECKWLTHVKKTPEHVELQGGITAEQPPILLASTGFNVLGFREAGHDSPWSEWIGKMLDGKTTVAKVFKTVDAGHSLVSLNILMPELGKEYKFVFVADQDCVCRDLEIIAHNNAAGWYQKMHVTSIKQFDKLWLPVAAVSENGNKDMKNINNLGVKSLTFDTPSDDEMKIDFPPGTRVLDSKKLQYYTIATDGNREYHEFYDSNTGKIIQPATVPYRR